MIYKIVLQRNWHWRRDQLMTPGTYRVPEDISEEMAARALKEEGAVRVDLPKAKPAKVPEPDATPAPEAEQEESANESEGDEKPKRKRGRPPKSKALGLAPENKSTLD